MKSAAPVKIKDVVKYLETIAPPAYQESYDNAGLIVGDANETVKGVLFCLDSVEAVVAEAVAKNCNLIVAHHPIIFKGLKRLNGSNYVERTVISAIRHGIAIYAIHTNLDNMLRKGVNAKIAEKLGLQQPRVLAPKQELKKLTVHAPTDRSAQIRTTLEEIGVGVFGNALRSFATLDTATVKLEVLFHAHLKGAVVQALQKLLPSAHLAFEIQTVENNAPDIGAGIIGALPKAMDETTFLNHLKKTMRTDCVRHTRLLGKDIQTVAVCGGAGGFLLPNAIAQGADIFVTADYKYHEFFDADGHLVIADIGHYESEQFTIELLHELFLEKFSTFALHFTEVNTNPVHYF